MREPSANSNWPSIDASPAAGFALISVSIRWPSSPMRWKNAFHEDRRHEEPIPPHRVTLLSFRRVRSC